MEVALGRASALDAARARARAIRKYKNRHRVDTLRYQNNRPIFIPPTESVGGLNTDGCFWAYVVVACRGPCRRFGLVHHMQGSQRQRWSSSAQTNLRQARGGGFCVEFC